MIINSFGTIISHNPINRISIFLARVKNNYRKCIVFGMKILFETRRDETISFDLLENFSNVGRMDSFFLFSKINVGEENSPWRVFTRRNVFTPLHCPSTIPVDRCPGIRIFRPSVEFLSSRLHEDLPLPAQQSRTPDPKNERGGG